MRLAVAVFALMFGSCGYHVAGHADLMPKTIHTVCIPAFQNSTIRYKLTDRLPGSDCARIHFAHAGIKSFPIRTQPMRFCRDPS